ncbi:hypothetical protein VO64_5275 [Pseudomonas synxantha]|uniref:Uncharacterized protein n=1 Tax=Pseudomonas synxantha TaxID=47883 RepID=A0AAU8TWA7_9PSED|nr:hypothetical protein VO64_5275 [Pseudomonas synxantha]
MLLRYESARAAGVQLRRLNEAGPGAVGTAGHKGKEPCSCRYAAPPSSACSP